MAFEHKKSLGQNFLNSDYVPKRMCDAAGLGEAGSEAAGQTTVLEIGPGTGALTRELLARGANVIAVEADARAISTLNENFAEEIARGQLTLHHHDARQLDPAHFGLVNQSYVVIANIPYYLSGLLLRQLLDTNCQPTDLVFLIQKELAERIARDQKESLLSLSVKAFGDPSYICTVKRSHFTPPPKVDSAIIAVRHISHERIGTELEPLFFQLLHLGFGQKRKQLTGNLASVYPREQITHILADLHLPLTIRAEDVSLHTWKIIASRLHHTK